MKVLQINTVCGTGSTGRIAADIYRTLSKNDHDGMIAYGRGSASDDIRSYRIGTKADMLWHGLYTRLTDRHGFASKNATNNLIREIENDQPDIIHLHNIHGYYLHMKVLFEFLKDYRKPVFWTLHDCWSFTGHCAHFEYIGCMKWQSGCYDCPQKKEYPSNYGLDASARNYREKKQLFTSIEDLTLIVPSHWLASKVQSSFLKAYETVIIPNGIDLKQFRPVSAASADLRARLRYQNQFLILGAAHPWSEKKGLSYFTKLAERLSDQFLIVLVGLNQKQIKQLPASIIGLPRTNCTDELAELYSLADIFVNFTLEDTFPSTNLEALACGTPVLTFRSGGSPESLDETCGFVVDQGDIEATIRVLQQVKNGPDMSAACLEKARLFDSANQFQKYIALYESK